MKHILMVWTVSIWALAATALAQGPDDQYVHIYNLIQRADELVQSGQGRVAYDRYREAQTLLKDLATTFPDWYPRLVKFRQDYVMDKLARFGPLPVETTPTAEPVEKPDGTTNIISQLPDVAPSPAQVELQNKVQILAQENQRLATDKAALEAKLREAMAPVPATVDPRQLSKAEATILTLQKENALLKVSLQQAEAKIKAPAGSAALDEARKALTQTNAKLTQQTQLIETLKQEMTILKAHAPAPADSASLNQLKMENEQLKQRVKELESRRSAPNAAKPAPAPGVDARQLNKLEKERDDLRKELAAANQKLAGSRTRRESARVKQLNQQLDALQAKLNAYESKKVPYTPEELALFKQPEASASMVRPAEDKPSEATKRSPNNIPVGAGPLVAEAHRAFAAGRLEEAEQKYKQVLSMDEKNIFTLGNLAAIALERDQLDASEKYLKQALALAPDDADNLCKWGILKLRQEKNDEALEALSRSVKLESNNPEAQNHLGVAFSQKGQREAAETALRKAVQLSPDYGNAHYNLAVVYAMQQPPFLALARYHYKKALACGQRANPGVEKMLTGAPPANKPNN